MSSKFSQLASGQNPDNIRAQRAGRLEVQTKSLYQQLVNTAQDQVFAYTTKVEELLDIAPDTEQSLRGKADFDPKKFVQEHHAAKVAVVRAQEELDIAVASFTELFGEAPGLYSAATPPVAPATPTA